MKREREGDPRQVFFGCGGSCSVFSSCLLLLLVLLLVGWLVCAFWSTGCCGQGTRIGLSFISLCFLYSDQFPCSVFGPLLCFSLDLFPCFSLDLFPCFSLDLFLAFLWTFSLFISLGPRASCTPRWAPSKTRTHARTHVRTYRLNDPQNKYTPPADRTRAFIPAGRDREQNAAQVPPRHRGHDARPARPRVLRRTGEQINRLQERPFVDKTVLPCAQRLQ